MAGAPVVVRWTTVRDGPTDADGLAAGERDRLVRFRQDADRRRFVGVRLLVRQVLAEVLGCAAADVELRQRCERCGGSHGRPQVHIAGEAGPRVSLAHAGHLAVVAVADQDVGVDVEPLGAHGRSRAELERWVRTEAVLKATGQGLDVEPSTVDPGPAGSDRLARWAAPGRRPNVRLADVAMGADVVGAVARLGRGRVVVDAAAFDLSLPPQAPGARATGAMRRTEP